MMYIRNEASPNNITYIRNEAYDEYDYLYNMILELSMSYTKEEIINTVQKICGGENNE